MFIDVQKQYFEYYKRLLGLQIINKLTPNSEDIRPFRTTYTVDKLLITYQILLRTSQYQNQLFSNFITNINLLIPSFIFLKLIFVRMDKNQDFDSDDSLDSQEAPKLQYICIKRHLSSAKSLLQGISFEPSQPKVLYDCKLENITTVKGSFLDQCHMNKLEQAMFDHFKLKQQVKQAIHGQDSNNNFSTFTLNEKYRDKFPIFQKFGYKNRKYYATQMVNLRGGNKQQKSSSNKWICGDNSIYIDSCFESGNLYKAYKVGQHSYELILQNDINTKGNNQWFFFRVKGVPKNTLLKFQIVNLVKKQSLFNEGMKPTVFSKTRFDKKGIGWVRQGQKINYVQNNIRKQHKQGNYFSLTFQYKSVYDNDEIYFSHSFPYTYTDLNQFMSNVFSQVHSHLLLSLATIGETISGNRVDVISITGKNYNKDKKIVWIMARQHPGEVTSSFMIEGIIKTLLGNSDHANFLRQRVVFKIIPMVNPDGVIHGNSRCQIAGVDPNRKWKCPSKVINPIIYKIKQLIKRSKESIDLILDLHSHSRKLGTFFYGNASQSKQKSRLYPFLTCSNDERFSFASSRFSEGSKTTARYSLQKVLSIPNIFTVQSSFYGYQKDHRIVEYSPDDYRDMGRSLVQSYAIMLNQQNLSVDKMSLSLAITRLKEDNNLIQQGDKLSIGSDSDPSGDQLDEEQLKKILPKNMDILKKKKKKILKKKKVQKKQSVTPQIKVEIKLEQVKQSKSAIKKPLRSNLCQRRFSLAPLNRKFSVQEKHKESLKRQLYSFNPSQSTQTQDPLLSRQMNRVDCSRFAILQQKAKGKQIWVQENKNKGTQIFDVNASRHPSVKFNIKKATKVSRVISDLKENRASTKQRIQR